MKASYERPLTRAELIALLGYFYGSPDRDRLEQIAAHDAAQREIIDAQARENALLASEPAKGAETLGPRECGGRCHDAVDSRTPCPGCAAEMAAPPDTADARRAAEATARYLLGVADEARLGEFESELVDCIRALLAAEPAKAPFVSRNEEWGLRPDFTTAWVTAPPAGAEVREALAEIVEWSASEAPCACDVDSPVECWLCRWHSRATAALAARPAVVDGAEVGEAAERLETWTDPATGDQYAHGRCVGAPASAGIGEAAKIIRRIVTNHDARITERGVLVYGRPSVSTGFVEAIEWLRRYDAARGGE